MKTPILAQTLLVALCFIGSLFAADDRAVESNNQSAATEGSLRGNAYVFKARSKPAASTSTEVVNSEVYNDVVIPVGKNIVIQSTLDYSFASTVAVSVLCSACITKTVSLSALGLVLEARWQSLYAAGDTATQNASMFAYTDAGGAVFNVYAEQFNLELQNKGVATITLDRVTIFRPAH